MLQQLLSKLRAGNAPHPNPLLGKARGQMPLPGNPMGQGVPPPNPLPGNMGNGLPPQTSPSPLASPLRPGLEKAGAFFRKRRDNVPVKGTPPEIANKDNVDSEIRPHDLRNPPDEYEAEQEIDLVNLVMSRYEDASKARRIHEREWLLCTAFERGNQWVEWRDATNRLESLVDPNDPYRTYMISNIIRPLTTKLKARATMSKPDAGVKPLTPRPQDMGAAAEARDILAHYDQQFDRQHQTQNWVDSALSTSTTFLKISWEPDKEALTSYIDDQSGEIIVSEAGIGDIDEVIIPPFEMYPDPKARAWDECEWIIHAKVRSLTYIQEKYGDRGYRVRGETQGQSSNAGYWEGRMDSITGESFRNTAQTRANSATVYECWEKPSPRYPKGRMIRVAGKVLLTEREHVEWPYEKRDTFPFVPLGFQEKFGTIWSLNAVHDLIPLQRNLNNIMSRIIDRINTDKPTILIPNGAEISIDAYQSKRNFQKIYYEAGMPPTYQTPPSVNSEWFTSLEMLKGMMEDITGVHEVSNGAVPPGVTAGNAIELLQQSDQTQLSEFVGNIETACRQRAEWELALAAQYYKEPRLIGISQESSNDLARKNAQMFENLTNGGRVRVAVTPGSATPKTPAARIQQYMDLAKSGLLQPEALPVLKVLVDLMGMERSDTLASRIDAAMQEIQQQQPNQALLQQQQAQNQAMLQQQAAQTQAQLAQQKTQNEIALAQARAQVQGINIDRAFQRDLMLQAHNKAIPDIRISGSLDPHVSAEVADYALTEMNDTQDSGYAWLAKGPLPEHAYVSQPIQNGVHPNLPFVPSAMPPGGAASPAQGHPSMPQMQGMPNPGISTDAPSPPVQGRPEDPSEGDAGADDSDNP